MTLKLRLRRITRMANFEKSKLIGSTTLLGLIPLIVYAPKRLIYPSLGPTNDDGLYIQTARMYLQGDLNLLSYILQTTNGHITAGARLFYLFVVQFPSEYFYFFKQIALSISLWIFSIVLLNLMKKLEVPNFEAVLIILIFQSSNPVLQVTSSIFLYVQLYFVLSLFLLSVIEIISKTNLGKLKLYLPLLALVGISSVITWVATASFLFLYYIYGKQSGIKIDGNKSLKNFLTGSSIFVLVIVLIHSLSRIFSDEQTENQDPTPLSEIVKNNIFAIFTARDPISPYSNEYGSDISVLSLNFTTNLLNWLIPSFIYDDLQSPFKWAELPTFMIAILVSAYIMLKNSGANLKIFLSGMWISAIVVALATYSTRGLSFAWYHWRYQPYTPVFSILITSLLIKKVLTQTNELSKSRKIIQVMLCLVLCNSIYQLSQASRFLSFWGGLNGF